MRREDLEANQVHYDFTYIDSFDLQHHLCTDELLYDSYNEEFSQLLNAFKKFLHVCGYPFVDEVVAKWTRTDGVDAEVYSEDC